MSFLRGTRRARNPNLQVSVFKHASHVSSQHSFGLPLTMNGMPRTQLDHACFERVLTFCHVKLMQSTVIEQKRLF